MKDILNFMFSGFWTFLGCIIILGILVNGFLGLMKYLAVIFWGWPDENQAPDNSDENL